jgi:hypothetical protein
MCKGVCLDWIRRIMNGKPAVYNEDKYDKDEAKRKKRLEKMKQTHELMNKVIRDTGQAAQQSQEEAQSLRTKITIKSWLGRAMFWTPSVTDMLNEQEHALDLVDRYCTDVDTIGVIPTNWVSFRVNWKHEVLSEKTGQQKTARFDNIRVEGGKAFIPAADTDWPSYFASKLTALKTDRCAMLNVFFAEGAHAVAVHRTNTGTLDFYDPNYGIFDFTLQGELEQALEYLFAAVYPSHNWQRGKADWLIFYPKGDKP